MDEKGIEVSKYTVKGKMYEKTNVSKKVRHYFSVGVATI